MKKILFVCHGNICRSPMAEFIFKHLVKEAGREDEFQVESGAVSDEEVGNPIYPAALRQLKAHGVRVTEHYARQLKRKDYEKYDLFIGMDRSNLLKMQRIFGGDPEGKIHLLLDYTQSPGDVADPWYSQNFEAAWRDIEGGCRALLEMV